MTTHLAIYHQELDGSRMMYRHFLRNTQGAILEMFGDMKLNFGSQFKELEELMLYAGREADQDIEDFMG